jgi:hypothetical protein
MAMPTLQSGSIVRSPFLAAWWAHEGGEDLHNRLMIGWRVAKDPLQRVDTTEPYVHRVVTQLLNRTAEPVGKLAVAIEPQRTRSKEQTHEETRTGEELHQRSPDVVHRLKALVRNRRRRKQPRDQPDEADQKGGNDQRCHYEPKSTKSHRLFLRTGRSRVQTPSPFGRSDGERLRNARRRSAACANIDRVAGPAGRLLEYRKPRISPCATKTELNSAERTAGNR